MSLCDLFLKMSPYSKYKISTKFIHIFIIIIDRQTTDTHIYTHTQFSKRPQKKKQPIKHNLLLLVCFDTYFGGFWSRGIANWFDCTPPAGEQEENFDTWRNVASKLKDTIFMPQKLKIGLRIMLSWKMDGKFIIISFGERKKFH